MPYRQGRIVPNAVFSRIFSSLVLNVYVVFFLVSLRKLSLLGIPLRTFTIFNLHFPFLAHILLLLQYTFLPSKVFNFSFVKYNKTVFNLHNFNEFGCRT